MCYVRIVTQCLHNGHRQHGNIARQICTVLLLLLEWETGRTGIMQSSGLESVLNQALVTQLPSWSWNTLSDQPFLPSKNRLEYMRNYNLQISCVHLLKVLSNQFTVFEWFELVLVTMVSCVSAARNRTAPTATSRTAPSRNAGPLCNEWVILGTFSVV